MLRGGGAGGGRQAWQGQARRRRGGGRRRSGRQRSGGGTFLDMASAGGSGFTDLQLPTHTVRAAVSTMLAFVGT